MATLTSRQVATQHTHRRPALHTNRYRDNVYYQDGHIVTAILASLLYLLVAVSLDAAGYTDQMSILVPVTAGALVLGLLMSFSRFDGFFAMSHSLFTGFAWILFLMSTLVTPGEIQSFQANGIDGLQARSYQVLLAWVIWVGSALNSEATADNYVFVFEISFLVWWLTFLGIWSIFRYGYTWRAIVPAGIVLAINVFNAPNPVLGFLIVFSLVALVMLVRTNLAEQQLRWREQRIYFSPDITFDFLRSALYYSAIVLALAWVVPGLGRNQEVQSMTAPMRENFTELTQRFNELHPNLNQRELPSYASFGPNLTLGGARQVEDRPILQIRADKGRYWRAVTYDYYDGAGWQNTRGSEQNYDALETIPAPNWANREPVTQTITLLSSTGGIVFAAQDLLAADIPVTALAEPVEGPEEAFELTYTTARNALEPESVYTVVSNYSQPTQQALRSAIAPAPPTLQAIYTQLPPDFSTSIGELAAQITAGQPTTYDKAKAIEEYLRANYPYNEEIPAPPAGVDPIEYFLFDLREGYCDYYATSMVLMLRSLGIPARAASGYAQGAYDQETRTYLITGDDAHTWVEVYFPGQGWIEFEPTAGEGPLNRPTGVDPAAAIQEQTGEDSTLPEEEPPLPDEGLDPALQNLPEDALLGGGDVTPVTPWLRWIWLLITPLIVLAVLWLMRRTRIVGPDAFSPDVSPIIYDRMLRWAERLGISLGAGQTPYEHANRLSRSLPGGRPYIDDITEEYVVYRFSGQVSEVSRQEDGTLVLNTGSSASEAWQSLRPMLQKAWMQRQVGNRRRKRNPFDLQ